MISALCLGGERLKCLFHQKKCVFFLLLPAAESLSSTVLSQTPHSCPHIHYSSLEAFLLFKLDLWLYVGS